jgi:hypothetical protein
MTPARQRLGKHVPEITLPTTEGRLKAGVWSQNKRPLLGNGLLTHVCHRINTLSRHNTYMNNSSGTLEGRDFYLVLLKLQKGGLIRTGEQLVSRRQGLERVLDSHWLWAVIVIVIKHNCNRSANKSNHPTQNPLLLVTEPRTRDNIFTIYLCTKFNMPTSNGSLCIAIKSKVEYRFNGVEDEWSVSHP